MTTLTEDGTADGKQFLFGYQHLQLVAQAVVVFLKLGLLARKPVPFIKTQPRLSRSPPDRGQLFQRRGPPSPQFRDRHFEIAAPKPYQFLPFLDLVAMFDQHIADHARFLYKHVLALKGLE